MAIFTPPSTLNNSTTIDPIITDRSRSAQLNNKVLPFCFFTPFLRLYTLLTQPIYLLDRSSQLHNPIQRINTGYSNTAPVGGRGLCGDRRRGGSRSSRTGNRPNANKCQPGGPWRNDEKWSSCVCSWRGDSLRAYGNAMPGASAASPLKRCFVRVFSEGNARRVTEAGRILAPLRKRWSSTIDSEKGVPLPSQ